jgi:hypothetical protein
MPDLEDDDGQDHGNDSSVIKQLRKDAAEAKAAVERANQAEDRALKAEQRATLTGLGIKNDDPRYELIVRAHEGDWTEDAVKATLTKYNLTPQQVDPAVQSAHQRADTATAGASSSEPVNYLQQLADLPAYGRPGWEEGAEKALQIAQAGGVEVVRIRGKQPRWLSLDAQGRPTGQTVAGMTQDSAVTKPLE